MRSEDAIEHAIRAGLRVALAALCLAPFRAAAGEPAPDDLAHEIEAQMRADRDDERALWKALFAEWQRALQDAASASQTIAPVRVSCVPTQDAVAQLSGDPVRHGTLAREDFRAKQQEEVKLQVDLPNAEVGAHVGVGILCIGAPRIASREDGSFDVRMDDVEYVALLDRERSWWNPRSDERRDAVLRHEQCHFDLAETLARRLTAGAHEAADATEGVGASATEAAQAFSARWKEHLGEVFRELQELEARYDRETAHGTLPAQQTEWLERCRRGLAETTSHAR